MISKYIRKVIYETKVFFCFLLLLFMNIIIIDIKYYRIGKQQPIVTYKTMAGILLSRKCNPNYVSIRILIIAHHFDTLLCICCLLLGMCWVE